MSVCQCDLYFYNAYGLLSYSQDFFLSSLCIISERLIHFESFSLYMSNYNLTACYSTWTVRTAFTLMHTEQP